jgi:glucosamine-6-phosphate deaminase
MSVMSRVLHHPKIISCANAASASKEVARHFQAAISEKPDLVLGLATGNSPKRVYDHLVEAHLNEGLSFANVQSFNLDEYVGLTADHPASFAAYMRERLFSKVDVEPDRTHVPNGKADDLDAMAAAYEAAIAKAGGIDIQLLGIGTNGHIAFNEPGSSYKSRTRVVELSASTIASNAADFPAGESVPQRAITMGIGTILEAHKIVLLATGTGKAVALDQAINGPISEECPASFLQLHPNVIIVCDTAAFSIAASHQQS